MNCSARMERGTDEAENSTVHGVNRKRLPQHFSTKEGTAHEGGRALSSCHKCVQTWASKLTHYTTHRQDLLAIVAAVLHQGGNQPVGKE